MNTKESAEELINYAIFLLQAVAGLFLILAVFYFPSSKEILASDSAKNTPDIPVKLYKNSQKDLQDQSRPSQTLSPDPNPISSPTPLSINETKPVKHQESSQKVSISFLSSQKQSEPSRTEKKPSSTTNLEETTEKQQQKNNKNTFNPPLEDADTIEPYQLYERNLITKDNVLERIPLIAAIPFYAVDATFDIATTALATAIKMPLSILSVYK
jgi:hypothetical protein